MKCLFLRMNLREESTSFRLMPAGSIVTSSVEAVAPGKLPGDPYSRTVPPFMRATVTAPEPDPEYIGLVTPRICRVEVLADFRPADGSGTVMDGAYELDSVVADWISVPLSLAVTAPNEKPAGRMSKT